MLRTKALSVSRVTITLALVVLALASLAMAQTEYKFAPPREYKTPATEKRGWTDGTVGGGYAKPDPKFKPSYLPNGQLDIRGVWRITVSGTDINGSIEALDENDRSVMESKVLARPSQGKVISRVVDPTDGKIPYKPWARKLRDEFDLGYIDPQSACVQNAMPRFMSYQENRITQLPDKVLMSTGAPSYRHIYTDGRPHPSQTVKMYGGASRGRWEKDALLTDVRNFNDKTWLSLRGDYHSDQMRVQERITRISKDMLQYEAVIFDPVVFDRPWAVAWPLILQGDTNDKDDVDLEVYCAEANLSIVAQVEGGRKLYRGLNEVLRVRPEIKR